MSKHNANFEDPIRLVLRMLKSKNKAAYSALVREALCIGASPIDSVLSLLEKRILHKAEKSQHPLLLIIGAPRSGTTLVYQALSQYLDVTFPSNASAVLKKSPITAARMLRRLTRRSRPNFDSYYGQTSRMSDCNDGFDLWNRWLGEDRYSPNATLSDQQSAQMRGFFDAWTTAFDKPFLNKNNRNALAVSVLGHHLPNAKFLVVRRNPVYVAQSLIVARKKIQGSTSVGWGLNSSSTVRKSDPLAYVDDVCSQIKTIDDEMDRQLMTVDSDRILNLTYEGFCHSPQQTITDVVQKFDGVRVKPEADPIALAPFEISQKLTINKTEIDRICERFGIDSPAKSPFSSPVLA